MLKDEFGEETRRTLQSDRLVLRAVLEDCLHEDPLHIRVLELHGLKAFDVLDGMPRLESPDVLSPVAQLDDDALAVDLNLTDHDLLECSRVGILILNLGKPFLAITVQSLDDHVD